MSKLKSKKYVALLGILILVIGIIGLISYGRVDKYKGLVKLRNVKTSTKVLSSVGNVAGVESKGFDEVAYNLTYTLDEIEGVATRDVVIKGTLSDKDFKYARFKQVSGDNYSSVISEEGKNIEITVEDVPLGVTQTLEVKVVIEGAPNGTKIKPSIDIKEKTGEYTRASTEEIEIITNSLEGKVTNEANAPIANIELSANQNGTEIKRTYTNENGEYTFTDLDKGNYEIKVEEEIYELVGEKNVSVEDNSKLDLIVKTVSPYTIETHKYIKNLNLIVNGKEENYSYKDAETVVQNVKNAKTIEGQIEYKIVVKNTGEKEGTVTQVIDEAGEGLTFNAKKNDGWEEKDGMLYYKNIEGSTLKSKEKREIKLVLDITKTSEIKTYLNKLTANGEIYEKVAFVVNGETYSEDKVLQGETVSKPSITLDNFNGWYTDKNYTNKYKFTNPVNKDLILYGYTQANKCKVSFMDRGELYKESEVTCGEKVTAPTDPSHEGYSFKEWVTENNNKFDFNKPVETDMVLNSKYDLVTYTLKYNYNGGSLEEGKTNPTTYTIETEDFTLNNPSKRGYTFIGWTEKDSDTPSTTYTIRKGTTGNKTITANYNVIEYNITYDLDGGSLEEGKTNRNKYTVETEDFTLNNPSKRGYTFEGWTGTDLESATKAVTISQGSVGDRSYKAIYKAIEYEIEYKGLTSEEISSLGNRNKYTVETEDFTLNNPSTRKDNDGDDSELFVGWTGSNGNDASTLVTVVKGSKTGKLTFTANWIEADPDIYPITYELNGGTLGKDDQGNDITNPKSYTKKDNDFTLNNPSKKGYTFIGWSGTDLVGNENITVTIPTGSRGARNYTANYTPIEYPINYNLDGGNLEEGKINPSSYTIETDDIILNDPIKKGYEFIGWEGTDIDTATTPVKILKGSTGERSYTAKYNKIKYNITYELNEGNLEEGKTNPTEYYVDSDEIVLNNPSKRGYTFNGWTSDSITTPQLEVRIPTGSTGDLHFVANYTAEIYNITYDLDGGELEEEKTNPSTYTIETDTFTLNNPKKEGYKFVGWSGTGINGNSTEVTIEKGSTGDRSYKATWGPNVYNVKFINDGNLYRLFSVNYLEKVTRPGDPSKGNYSEFKYWSTENKAISENPVEFDFETQIDKDYTLYAIYEDIEAPTITHTPDKDENGKTIWTNQNVTVTVSSSHEDYSYMSKKDDGSYVSYSGPFEVEENGTIYAYSTKNGLQSIETTHDITNIDKINPRINNLSASGVNMTEFTVNIAAKDDESGIQSITLYKDDVLVGEYLYDDEDTGEKIKSVTLSNLEENTTYHMKAIAKDKAGNISDAFEKDIKTEQLIVARIIGENGELWEDEERYINFGSLKDAIEYEDCVSNQCTIQMVQGTNESNVILSGQDITLDLNGKIVMGVNDSYTLQNNGKLTVVDNNENETGILYNQTGASVVNNGDDAILTLGVNDEELNVSITKPEIIGKTYGVDKVSGIFNFYDGYIEGTNAINGTVDDTPYLHNARVSSIAQSDSTIKQKAILSRVADAEARIGSVYYTRLADAIDKSNIGTMDITTQESTYQQSLVTYGDYGFVTRNGEIVPEDDAHVKESKSVIPIDLTDATQDQLMIIGYDAYNYNEKSDNGRYEYIGNIKITDELGTSSTMNTTIVQVEANSSGVYVNSYGSNQIPSKTTISLAKGKVYYLYLEGDVKVTEINVGTSEMGSISNIPNYSFTNDGILYGFEYDEETGSLRSNNNYTNNTTAYTYYEIDLTNETDEFELSTNISFDAAAVRGSDYAMVAIREDKPKYDINHYNLYSSDCFIYIYPSTYSSYGYSENGRFTISNRDYKTTLLPGKKYYIEYYYYKYNYNGSYYDSYPKNKADYDAIGSKDEFVINKLDVYKKEKKNLLTNDDLISPGEYGFRIGNYTTNGEYNYNGTYANTTAHSYIPVDLTDSDSGKKMSIKISSNSGINFYFKITDSEEMPSSDGAIFNAANISNSVSMSSNDTHEHSIYANFEPGKKQYLHFVYKRGTESNGPSINELSLTDGWAADMNNDRITYGDSGFNNFDSYYVSYYNDTVPAGDKADTSIKVDLTNATENQVVYLTAYQSSSTFARYAYITDTPKNMTYSYISSHKNETVFFNEQSVNYNYGKYSSSGNITSYTLAHPILLPKGRVYYIHFAGYNASSSSYTGTGLYLNSVTTMPIKDLKIHIGKTTPVLHGNETPSSATGDKNIIIDETEDANVRYVGKDAKNHISFNNEDWRIIGIFNTEDENGNIDQRLKIVRGDSIKDNYSIDSSENSSNNSSSGINEWSQADVMKLLNPGYEDDEASGSLYYNSGSGKCYISSNNTTTDCDFTSTGLKDSSKAFIEDVVWNTGALTTDEYTAKELYEAERGEGTGKTGISKENYFSLDTVERKTTWVGKVGLIYPSDFIYSTGGWTNEETGETYTRKECIETFNGSCYSSESWMWENSGKYPYYTMTASNTSSYSVLYSAPGKPYASSAVASFTISPVVYLSDKTKITSGDGTSSNPYKIELGSSKNTDNDYGLVEKNENYEFFAKDDTDDENYRFFGKDPNNYISFNDENWRIIGIFKVKDKNGDESYRLKIVKGSENIYRGIWDSSASDSNSGMGINEWSQADLMKLLNPSFEDNTDSSYQSVEVSTETGTSYQTVYLGEQLVNNSLYWNKGSGLCYTGSGKLTKDCDFQEKGLNEDAKKYIDTVKWNTGAIPYSYSNISPLGLYEYERGNKTGKTDFPVGTGFPADNVKRNTYWYGKVAIPYVTDYIMASGNGNGNTRSVCMSSGTSTYGDCSSSNNWMNQGNFEMSLSPIYGSQVSSNYTGYAYGFLNSFFSTTMTASPMSTSTYFRPTVYLSTKTVIDGGTGTADDPYTIKLGEEKNNIPYYGLVSKEPEPGAVPVPEDYEDIETDDYKKGKNIELFGFDYDEDTHIYTPQNSTIKNSLSSATIEVDLTNEESSKNISISHNYTGSYFTFVVITDKPDPVYFHPYMNTCSSGLNCNNTSYNSSFYLDAGKKYYIHLGFLNWDYSSIDDYVYDKYNNGYGVWQTKIDIDQGIYSNVNPIRTYTYERNDDVDTVQVLKDISLDYNINIDKNRSVVLDLNGYTINSSTPGAMIHNSGELEIIDSKLKTNPDSEGKFINNNGSVIINNVDANLILTSGKISSTSGNGVENLGEMEMKEDFNILMANVGINNKDGVINDLAGTITQSTNGVVNSTVYNFNGEDSGTVKNISGPLNINASNVGINDVDSVNNATIYGGNIAIDNVNKVTNSTLSGKTAINAPEKNVSVSDTTINNCSTGITASKLDVLKNVDIECSSTGISAAIDDDTEIENSSSTASYALSMTSGNFVYDDESPIMLNGSISNNGTMVINLLEREITNTIGNSGTMTIKSFAETDIDNNINNSGNLTMNEKNLTTNRISIFNNEKTDIKNVTTNTLFVTGKSSEDFNKFEDGKVLTKLVVGAETVDDKNYSKVYDATIDLINTTVGTEDTAVSNIITYNRGTINADNTTFYGSIKNMKGGVINLNNNSVANDITSNGYYNHYYNTRPGYANNVHYDYYYYGLTEVNVNNSTIKGTISLGTSYIQQESYSRYNRVYVYKNGDALNINNNSKIESNIINNRTGVVKVDNSTTSTIKNDGSLTIGEKDGDMHENTPVIGKVTSGSYAETSIYFYDGYIYSSVGYPIETAEGTINEIEDGYYLDEKTDDSDNTILFLTKNLEVCKIGETKYASIGEALNTITEDTETPVEIVVIRSHPSLENIINNHNVIINFASHRVTSFVKNPYITNNGTMKLTGDTGKLIHGGATPEYTIANSNTMTDTVISNTGTMVFEGINTVAVDLATNGDFTMNSGSLYEVAGYENCNTLINDGILNTLSNEGTALVNNVQAKVFSNSGSLVVETNTAPSLDYHTRVYNYNNRASSNIPEKEVWLKSGTYYFIESTYNSSSYPINSTLKIGADGYPELQVTQDMKLNNITLEMTNTNVKNEAYNSTSLSLGTSTSANIKDSKITNRNNTSRSSTKKALYSSNGNVSLTNTSITCSYSYSYYPCIAIDKSAGTIEINGTSSITGTTGISGSSSTDVVFNDGTLSSSGSGIIAPCGDVEIVDGTLSSNGVVVDIRSSNYNNQKCLSAIYVGTNHEQTRIGTPSLTSTNSYGIYTSHKLNLVFANGSLNSRQHALYLDGYTSNYPVNVQFGTIPSEEVEINPTVVSTNGYGLYHNTSSSNTTVSNLNIARGTIKGYAYGIYSPGTKVDFVLGDTNDSDVSKTSPNIVATGSNYAVYTSANSFKMYDGLIQANTNKTISKSPTAVENGYTLIIKASSSGREDAYLDSPKIAKVNDTEYNSLKEAVNSANSGDTIEILTDYTYIDSVGTTTIPEGKELTIDFKGYTVTSKSTKNFIVNNGNVTIKNIKTTGTNAPIINNGDMTIEGTTLTFEVTNTGDLTVESGSLSAVNNNSQFTLNGGTVTTLNNNDGSADLIGGTITTLNQNNGNLNSSSNITNLMINNGNVVLHDGNITNTTIKDGTLTLGVKDGVVSETKPNLTNGITYPTLNGVVNFYDGIIGKAADSTYTHYIKSEVNRDFFDDIETGYSIVESTDTYKGLVLKQSYVIKNLNKDSNNEYRFIQDAIDEASTGDTLQLMKSISKVKGETEYVIPEGKEITFDFNGHSIYSREKTFTNNGSLKLKSSSNFYPNLFYLSIDNNGTLKTDETNTLKTIDIFELINNGNADLKNFTANKFNYTNNAEKTMNIDNVIVKAGTQTNNGNQTISNSTSFRFTMTNSGTLKLDNVKGNFTGARISNSGTVDFDDVNLTNIYTLSNSGTLNLNSGTINSGKTDETLYNTGIFTIKDSSILSGYRIENTGTVNFNRSSDANGITVNVNNNDGGKYYQSGGTNNGSIFINYSNNVTEINGGTINYIYALASSTIDIKNAIVVHMSVEDRDIIINASENSQIQGLATNNIVDGLKLYLDNSSVPYVNIKESSNQYKPDGEYPRTSKILIDAKNNSKIGDVINRYYTRTSGRSTYYDYAASLDIKTENSNITGNTLHVDNIEMDGGEIKPSVINSHITGHSIYIPTSCKFKDTTIKGDLNCGTEIKLESVIMTSNINGTEDLTIDRSQITGNIGNVLYTEFTDSTLTGTITSRNYSSTAMVVINSGTINGSITSDNQIIVKSGTVNNTTGTALNAPIVTVGENNTDVSTTDPSITGLVNAVYSDTLYFYDGVLTGGTLAYETKNVVYPNTYRSNIIKVGSNSVATLVPLGEDEIVADIDGNKFYGDLLAAINDCPDGGTIKLHRDIELTEDITIPEGKSIIIDLNNNEILNIEHLKGSYTTTDSTNPDNQGAIYKFLANLTGTEINPKNIIIYQMQDGEELLANETYKLYKLVDNTYKIVKVDESNIGKYKVGSKDEIIRTVNGKVYINNIGEGTYKLVSNTDREINFEISSTSISSNIKENPNYEVGTITSTSVATLILQLQTGVVRTPYLVIMSILIILIVLSYVLVKKTKKQFN